MKKIRDPSFFEGVNDFLTYYLPKIKCSSPNTITTYRITINKFISYLQEEKKLTVYTIGIASLNRENIVCFLDWLKSHGNSSATRNNRLSAMKSLYTYLMEYKDTMLAANANGILEIHKTQELDKGPHVFLTEQQVKLVLNAPNPKEKYGLRDQTLLVALYDSGCRIDEMLSLRNKDIRYSDGQCYITVTGKGRKTRNIPMFENCEKTIREYQRVFHPGKNPDGYLFYTLQNGVQRKMSPDNVARIQDKYEKQVKKVCPSLPHLHAHLWRHSRSQHLYEAGMSLEQVSLWLGHSQINTSLIYTFFDVERKRKAIEKATEGDVGIIKPVPAMFKNDEEIIKRLYGL